MAPRRRTRTRATASTKLRGGNLSTIRPSVEDPSNDVGSPSHNNDRNINRETKSINTSAKDQPSDEPDYANYVYVQGIEMPVSPTYDPDTYDPNKRMPWTPEPETDDPDAYAAWGRKHFGEEWYTLRQTMLKERNIYLEHDSVYRKRQRQLRIIEHKAEGRPFRPAYPAGELENPRWQRVWARRAKELGVEISRSLTPLPTKGPDDSETDLDGYSTFDPTPSPREPTPIPDDPLERLEFNRKRFKWNEERYYFESTFVHEGMIDGKRAQREDEPGDRLVRDKRERMERFRYEDRERFYIEQERFQAHIDLPKQGWTYEEIEALFDADSALQGWRTENPEPRTSDGRIIYSSTALPEDVAALERWCEKLRAAKIRFWGELPPTGSGLLGMSETKEEEDAYKRWRKNTYARLSLLQQQDVPPTAVDDASATKVASKPRDPSPRERKGKDVSRQSRSGRITKNAPTQAKGSPPNRRRHVSKPGKAEHVEDALQTTPQRGGRQRKTYTKVRASRRLAGKSPEFEMI